MANLISLIRTLLCFVTVGLLFIQDTTVYWTCFVLTIIVIWMDGLDGYVARKFNETSKAGAVIDILGDRIVEQVYWVSFLALGWVEVWVPLLVIVRGILVDGIRGLAFEHGFTAFGSSTMMQSGVGKFLVASNFSRWTYAFTKAVAFAFMILAMTPGLAENIAGPAYVVAQTSVYIAVFFCVVRGLPVLIEGWRFMATPAPKDA